MSFPTTLIVVQKMLLLTTVLVFCMIVPISCLNYSKFTVLWNDEFNEDNARPRDKYWNFDDGNGPSGIGNGQIQTYTDNKETIREQSGRLHIIATKETNSDGTYTFTSAGINTNKNVAVKYGLIVARIKSPNVIAGLWPAFWTMGNVWGTGPNETKWPESGSVDIMELGQGLGISTGVGNQRVVSAAHWLHEGTHAAYGKTYDTPNDDTKMLLNETFHIYAMDWSNETITTYFNDIEVMKIDIRPETCTDCEEFHRQHFLVLNMAIGGSYTSDGCNSTSNMDCGPGRTPEEITAPFPATMEVDWVRIYDNGRKQTLISCPGLYDKQPAAVPVPVPASVPVPVPVPASVPVPVPVPAPVPEPVANVVASPTEAPVVADVIRTESPTESPNESPTKVPTTDQPTEEPTPSPVVTTDGPTLTPTDEPTPTPSTEEPTPVPTKEPTTVEPFVSKTKVPTGEPMESPTESPTESPVLATDEPSPEVTDEAQIIVTTNTPTIDYTLMPTKELVAPPIAAPSCTCPPVIQPDIIEEGDTISNVIETSPSASSVKVPTGSGSGSGSSGSGKGSNVSEKNVSPTSSSSSESKSSKGKGSDTNSDDENDSADPSSKETEVSKAIVIESSNSSTIQGTVVITATATVYVLVSYILHLVF